MQNDQGASNAGFLALHNPLGVMIVCFSAILLVCIIAFGGVLAKHKMEQDRLMRQEMRRKLKLPRDN